MKPRVLSWWDSCPAAIVPALGGCAVRDCSMHTFADVVSVALPALEAMGEELGRMLLLLLTSVPGQRGGEWGQT